MPKPGWSKETIIKPSILCEIGDLLFTVIERIHANGKKHINQDYPFTYLDLTAGPGMHKDGVLGAATCFHSMLEDAQFDWRMYLIEEEREQYEKLIIHFEDVPEATCYLGDSQDIAPIILRSLQHRPHGLICLDPNGGGPTEESIIKNVSACPATQMMDWLFHFPATTIKRVRRATGTRFDSTLLDLIKLTGKKRGLIKRSPSRTKLDWFYIFLTNAESAVRQWKKQDWYDIDGKAGRQLIEIANYTKAERVSISSPRLFPE